MVESAQHKPSPAVALIDPVTQGEAPAVPQALLKLRSKRSTQPADSDDRPESEVGLDAGLSLDDAQLAVPEAGPILAVQAQADVGAHVPNAAAVGEASAASGAGAAQAPAAAVTGLGVGGDIAALGLAAAASLNAVSVASNGPDNAAPVFTDGATHAVNFAENGTGTVYTATATDNVAVARYAFADGGADNDKFIIDPATGAIRFRSAPNYEAPGSAAHSNAYTVKVKAVDAAGNEAMQTLTVNVTDVAAAPINTVGSPQTVNQDTDLSIAGLSVSDADPGASVSVTLRVAHGTLHVAGSSGVVQSGTGTDDNITLTGSLSDVNAALAAPNAVVYRGDLGYVGADTLHMQTTDSGPAMSADDQVAITVNAFALSADQTFALWQGTSGGSAQDVNAFNQYASVITAAHDATSRDGRANQPDTTKIQSQWMDQVTGTDIVSDAEYRAGFTITGHASAGAQATIRWRLDKDRTTGANGEGAQVLNIGANDVDNDGTPDVTVAYDNATGDWSMSFAPNSHALLQATHNTSGSGVHQLLVDTDGDGSRTGRGATAEASRLFLVADGTAGVSSTSNGGTTVSNTEVAGNFSVQDQITGDVFVYYYGDPDGTGIGLWTLLDNGDSANDPTVVTTDQDQSTTHSSDWDYYNNPTDNAAGTPATTSNTALHLVTNIAAQTWEFHAASNGLNQDWDVANAQAKDHNVFGSNSSRQISLVEAMALYAANFGGDSPGGNTVGAVQPMSNAGSTNGYVASEDNHPQGWGFVIWTAAPTPSGHAILYLNFGDLSDLPDANEYLVAAVL